MLLIQNTYTRSFNNLMVPPFLRPSLSLQAHHPIDVVYNELHPQWNKSVAYFLRWRPRLKSLALTFTHVKQIDNLCSPRTKSFPALTSLSLKLRGCADKAYLFDEVEKDDEEDEAEENFWAAAAAEGTKGGGEGGGGGGGGYARPPRAPKQAAEGATPAPPFEVAAPEGAAIGKKAYVIAIKRRITPEKLANFPDAGECDVLVLVACAEGVILDDMGQGSSGSGSGSSGSSGGGSRAFYAPVVTPFEALMALEEGREWTGEYRMLLDGAGVVAGGSGAGVRKGEGGSGDENGEGDGEGGEDVAPWFFFV
ncbi:unnamed protein product [Closterium sp. NIES-65]|nr:unnamed protein product [Closterium sp. NIES-65]